MRMTLGELHEEWTRHGRDAFVETYGEHFLVCDPSSAFNIPHGPRETQRIDRRALDAFARGDFHASTPVFVVRRREGSPYRFVSVGRTDNCDVALPDDSISKLHALIREHDGAHTIQDAGSANGTFVDENKVPARDEGDAVALAPGARVRVGRVNLHYVTLDRLRALFEELDATI